MSTLYDGPLAFVDLETTGCEPRSARIIEIGLVAAAGGALQYEWSTLINPGTSIPPSVQHFTGITDEMVRDAPFFEDVAAELAERLGERLFIAHNARFDYGFLRREFRRLGRAFTSRVACTVKLSRRLQPAEREHNLDALIARHGLHCERRHRALPDAQTLWQFWSALPRQLPSADIEAVLYELLAERVVPAHLQPQLAEDLPEGPGVYRFFGEGDARLYIGKAKDIRARVFSHWSAGMRDERAQQLTQLTRRVDWIETAGELGALLLEARLIREQQPLYNRRLRQLAQVLTWVVADDGVTPELALLGELPLSFERSDAFGLYRSEEAARKALTGLAREHRLCLKVLGLEAARGSCFAYQLGRCAGACIGAEPLARHALRVKLALLPHRLKPWPYPGAVGIRESAEQADTGASVEIHVVDQWRHVTTLREGDTFELCRRAPSVFDLDVYRILSRYLRHVPASQLIHLSSEPRSAS
ncbi:MAG TPA: exonuclease domain-containing protein [Steroidobacteraceae bacterium]|nr:exonuclease domain-containing protein [Steroidobacteraceae bacterium]